MSTGLVPCLDCGTPSDGPRCTEHRTEHSRQARRRRTESGNDRPYNKRQWRRLSKSARTAQPWCSAPGCTSTDLTADHSPESWRALDRLGYVPPATLGGVYCRAHNTGLGPARGNNVRRDS